MQSGIDYDFYEGHLAGMKISVTDFQLATDGTKRFNSSWFLVDVNNMEGYMAAGLKVSECGRGERCARARTFCRV